MSKELLEEIIEQIREALPESADVATWIDNADKFEESNSDLTYQYGRLLGAAEWAGRTVLELLDEFEVSLEAHDGDSPEAWARAEAEGRCSPECRGWDHFNIGTDRECIERCDECDKYADDAEATKAHAKHCNCLAGVNTRIQLCHGCGVIIGEESVLVTIKNDRAYCTCKCADAHCQKCNTRMSIGHQYEGPNIFRCNNCGNTQPTR